MTWLEGDHARIALTILGLQELEDERMAENLRLACDTEGIE